MIQPWQQLQSRILEEYRIFKVRADLKKSPRTGGEHEFYILDTQDWVNVVAVTQDRQMVFVEQYRHGVNEVELELPGGIMDPEDSNPEITGARELKEETGYTGGSPKLLSSAPANPALMNNRFHSVYVPDCVLTHPLELDHAEDIETCLVPVSELGSLIRSGKLRHPLMLTAILHYFRLSGEDPAFLLG
jgi:8-oxo-dGTP pyrophosphatase MutT (NUDIX family)